MNFHFRNKHYYVIRRPYEQVESRLRYIITRRWDDYSMDLVGFMKKNGVFRITSKWGFMRKFRGLDNKPAHIRGHIHAEQEGTRIRMTIHPNSVLITLFYFVIGLMLLVGLDLETMVPVHKFIKLGFLLTINLILFMLITSYQKGLINRFEELMQIKGEQVVVGKEAMEY